MRSALAIAGLLFIAGQSHAQARSADSTHQAWVYLAAGPASANGRGRIGGDLGVWVTHDRLAFSVRTATASRLLETGEMGDVAAIVGVHPYSAEHSDVVAGIGLGMSRGRGTAGENLPARPAIAVAAQANLNFIAAGIGADAFALLADHRQVWGIGVAVMVGLFR